jgi:hypothetical protein
MASPFCESEQVAAATGASFAAKQLVRGRHNPATFEEFRMVSSLFYLSEPRTRRALRRRLNPLKTYPGWLLGGRAGIWLWGAVAVQARWLAQTA